MYIQSMIFATVCQTVGTSETEAPELAPQEVPSIRPGKVNCCRSETLTFDDIYGDFGKWTPDGPQTHPTSTLKIAEVGTRKATNPDLE